MRLENLHIALKMIAGIFVVLLVAWLGFLWFLFLPFRLAYRLHAPRSGGSVKLAELEGLAALALSGVALLRSRNAPMTRKEWKRKHRRILAQRPDDEIPF